MQNIPHIPVLYREVVDGFSSIKDGYIIDCTMGYGGHSSMLLEANNNIKLIAIDQDDSAIEFSTKRLEKFGDRVIIKKGRFSQVVKEIFNEFDHLQIRGILADIGVSSLQLDQRDRGFSFESENLDMRMDKDSPKSAFEVVNSYSQKDLEYIFKEYGELSNANKLASFIVSNRPFHSVKELIQKIDHLLYKGKNIHPATLVLQAIRIEVNDELKELESLLEAIENSNAKEMIVGIISFHSLEDRIVKQKFSIWVKSCICPDEAFRCTCGNNNSKGKLLTKKPIMAQNDEIKKNPRSRSAKLRFFEFKER